MKSPVTEVVNDMCSENFSIKWKSCANFDKTTKSQLVKIGNIPYSSNFIKFINSRVQNF